MSLHERVRVARDRKPPECLKLGNTKFVLVDTARNKANDITHYIYRSVKGGWLISFTDRQFIAGVENIPAGNTWGHIE